MSGLCGVCGSTDLSVGGDGFSYCNVCGSQSQFFQDQAFDYDDTHVYNARNVRERAVARKESLTQQSQLLQTQASQQLLHSQASQHEELAYFSQLLDNPTPYLSQVEKVVEVEEELSDRVRRVYVEGVQILVQMQCEALVERFGATPLVCGVLGPVWLKFMRSTGVFEKGWAEEALLVAEAQHERGDGEDDDDDEEEELLAGPDDKPVVKQTPLKPKRKKRVSGEPWTSYGERTRFVYLRSLKARIPLRASLAITFLVCHLTREPILPTDIINWAYEGTLPYLSAYTEIEKRFSVQTSHQLFKASKIFKPQRMTNSRVVEYLASLIADRIGLQLPPVNFHLISRRFLRELGLPVDALAPYVCRVFEWFPSSGVWLTSQVSKLPTRVCVMAVLVVVFKVLYKLDGRTAGEEDEEQEAFMKKVKALLEDDADQVDDQEQLTEYLRYCRETIFANDGMSNDEDLRDHFWELYEQSAKQGALRGTISRESEEVESETGLEPESIKQAKKKKKSKKAAAAASKLRTDPLLRGMEDLGFVLLDPPKEIPLEDEYWTYIITRDDMRPVHEQYLLVLRACAKIIDVDPRAMHLAVLNVEKGIIDAEKKVLKFLAMQQGRSLDHEATEQMEEMD